VYNSTFNGNGTDGLTADSAGDVNLFNDSADNNFTNGVIANSNNNITATCSDLSYDGVDAIYAYLPGTFTLNGVTLHGYSNIFPPPYSGGGILTFNFAYNCGVLRRITPLHPPSRSSKCLTGSLAETPIILSCPIGGNASLTELTFDGLPGALNSRFTFVSGLETEITPDRQTLNGRTTLDFMIPTGYAGCQLRHSALGREQVDGTSQLQNRWRFLRIPDEPNWYLRAGHEIDLLMSPKRDGA
jgi:hypothetical protein